SVREMAIPYPVVTDNDYAIWRAFGNEYWPASYFADAQGRIRHHQFGEGQYEQCEKVIRQLLEEVKPLRDRQLVSVQGRGIEAEADWGSLRSLENYTGYRRTENFASSGGAVPDRPHSYTSPARLSLNHWALSGNWTINAGAAILNAANGS